MSIKLRGISEEGICIEEANLEFPLFGIDREEHSWVITQEALLHVLSMIFDDDVESEEDQLLIRTVENNNAITIDQYNRLNEMVSASLSRRAKRIQDLCSSHVMSGSPSSGALFVNHQQAIDTMAESLEVAHGVWEESKVLVRQSLVQTLSSYRDLVRIAIRKAERQIESLNVEESWGCTTHECRGISTETNTLLPLCPSCRAQKQDEQELLGG